MRNRAIILLLINMMFLITACSSKDNINSAINYSGESDNWKAKLEFQSKTDEGKKLLRDKLTLQYTGDSKLKNDINYTYKTKFVFERTGSFPVQVISKSFDTGFSRYQTYDASVLKNEKQIKLTIKWNDKKEEIILK